MRCDKVPFRPGPAEGFSHHAEPGICILESFERTDDKLKLFFKNGNQAIIKAINIEGGREIDLIEEKMPNYINSSYEDILKSDI